MSNSGTNSTATCEPGFFGIFNCGGLIGTSPSTVRTLTSSLVYAFALFGIQLLIFIVLRFPLIRIYIPRSYLVPETQRVPRPPGGLVGWLYPVFTTPNLTIINKCGLDAYFFLRYLRLQLRIFFPAALIILPILLPINKTGGTEQDNIYAYSIQNISHPHYLWAHLLLAVLFICWIFFNIFKELRDYVRVRQAYLTSSPHRIRASATTVLVAGIPRKWLTFEALSGLYDVFPGGLRNIWINRNYDELSAKVKSRDKIARQLEAAETDLIKLCYKKNEKMERRRAKQLGVKKKSKAEKQQDNKDDDAAAQIMATAQGVSAGEQHEVSQGVQDILERERQQQGELQEQSRATNPIAFVGQGLGAVGQGLGNLGKGIGKIGDRVVANVDEGLHKSGQGLNNAAIAANTGGIPGFGAGFLDDGSLYDEPVAAHDTLDKKLTTGQGAGHSRHLTTKAAGAGTNTHKPRVSVQPPPQAPNPFATGLASVSQSPVYSNSGQHRVPAIRTTRPSNDTKPKESMEIEEPYPASKKHLRPWDIFRNHDSFLAVPSPQPHVAEEDEQPLHTPGKKSASTDDEDQMSRSKMLESLLFWRKQKGLEAEIEYPAAFQKDSDEDQNEEPSWRKYIEPKDRATQRLPVWSWFISLPFLGKKVDTIYHLRRELARLNLEIEADQNNPERFPLMNSAFIQFNHQIAAHMCCQSLTHHVPLQMAPRIIEISPNDVIWDNMAIKWWERYIRTFIAVVVSAVLTILWAVPVAFSSLLNKISSAAVFLPFLTPLANGNPTVLSIVQGVAPPILLTLILILVPFVFRLLIRFQGVPTYTIRELNLQKWFFAFLFIQVFLIVTLANGLTAFLRQIAQNPTNIPSALASNLPSAATYFYSYLTVQALGSSASSLVQVATLLMWFLWAPLNDSTARKKWRRQTQLSSINWGSFFPFFTNFAVIGIIYSVIAPLILVFILFIFSLYWIVQRYNIIFVAARNADTGGRLFPVAINQLFVGVYFLELCLIGLFFTLQPGESIAQAVIMIVVLCFSIVYQVLLNMAYKPFFQYLPITLEDEAVIRDEEFARAQASRFMDNHTEREAEPEDGFEHALAENEQQKGEEDRPVEDVEKREIEARVQVRRSVSSHSRASMKGAPTSSHSSPGPAWHQKARQPFNRQGFSTEGLRRVGPEAVARLRFLADGTRKEGARDVEAQKSVGDVLYGGYAEDLEDLSPEDRDTLVRYAFQHSALRARRPVVWIPRDKLGVSDDEIRRAKRMSTVEMDSEEKTMIWMSNDGTALDHKGRVVFRKSPPDFSEVELIQL